MNSPHPLADRANAAAAVAAEYADAVDVEARHPWEAIAALRELKLLGLLVPERYGGPGASLADVAVVCRLLGRACGSTALIFAMHQIQVACVIAGGTGSTWSDNFLGHLARDQLLLASVTSEVGVGGNIRASICAPEYSPGRLTLVKRSSAISYGSQADALLITARRNRDSAPSDQILILAGRDDVSLVETGCWDTLGMRGTGSKAFDVTLRASSEQILPVGFGDVAQHTMLPISHLLWGAAWLGIASDAAEKARTFLQHQLREKQDAVSSAALRFERAACLIANIQDRLDLLTFQYERKRQDDRDGLTLSFLTEINGLKIMVSEGALEVAQHAMMICGFSGYKSGTPYSIGRHLRDLQAAPLMVNNDRISGNIAAMLVAQRAPLIRT